jgi:hypothetical protein
MSSSLVRETLLIDFKGLNAAQPPTIHEIFLNSGLNIAGELNFPISFIAEIVLAITPCKLAHFNI